mgnify:CR=1 FL=1
MQKQQWNRIQTIFNDALEIKVPDQQQAFIQKAAQGDQALIAEVNRLLEQFSEADQYFAGFEQHLGQSFTPKASNALPDIPQYAIIDRLGEGGMATVFLAERQDGKLTQKVAIKLLKKGLDTEKIIQRFESEKQILATLKHPNLAQIYDAGVSQEGQPFFVMEYVEGLPLLEFCNTNCLSIEQRLDVFEQICVVLQHAHQNLIIHRDLKPSNILVTTTGQVKLLDFGIAKVLDAQDPLITQTGQVLLTPGYASPEQLLSEQVTTKSDIFQLGILLQELLIGQKPVNFGKSPSDWAHRLNHYQPPTLKNTWQNLDKTTQKQIAQQRAQKTNELTKIFQGDLGNIPLSCLQADPTLRYDSVGAIKEDLRRYRVNLPLMARKPSFGYQLRKFVRRQRVAVVFSGLLALSLLGGIVATIWQAQVARQNQHQAEQQQQRAERISEFLIKMFRSPDPRHPQGQGKDVTVKDFLGKGVANLESELKNEPALQLELLGIVSDLYDNLSYYPETKVLEARLLPQYKKKYGETSRQYLRSKLRLIKATYQLGQAPQADSLYQGLIQSYARQTSTEYAKILNEYALFLQTAKGNFPVADSILAEAEKIYIQQKDTLSTHFADLLSNQGSLKNVLGQLPQAQSYHQRELTISKKISREPIPIALAEADLSTVLQKLGKLTEAKKMQLKSLKTLEKILGEDHIHTIHALNNLAVIYLRNFDLVNGERVANRVLNLYQKKLGDRSYETGIAYLNTVIYLLRKNKYKEALARVDSAKRILDKTFPPGHYLNAVPLFAQSLIHSKNKQGNQALEEAKQAEKLIKPSIPPGHYYWGIVYLRKALAYQALGQMAQSLDWAQKSYQNLQKTLGDRHYNTQNAIALLVKLYQDNEQMIQSKVFQAKLIQKK